MERKRVSIIICTYNRSALLKNCILSLYQQDGSQEDYDIIVIDNNSSDNTADIVAELLSNHPHIRYIKEERQGLSYARNRGCVESDSEYLVYLDDDSIAPKAYIASLISVIGIYSPDIIGGPVYPFYTSKKPLWFKDEYEIRKYADESGFSTDCSVSGGNFIIRKAVLEKLGMFDPSYGIVGKRLRLSEERKVLETYRSTFAATEQKVFYSLECGIQHLVPEYKMKVGYFLKRSFLAGRGLAKIDIQVRHGNSPTGSIKAKFRALGRITSSAVNGKKKEKAAMDVMNILRYLFVMLGQAVELLEQVCKKTETVNNHRDH